MLHRIMRSADPMGAARSLRTQVRISAIIKRFGRLAPIVQGLSGKRETTAENGRSL
jgi:hypothetical protein